MFLTIVLVLIAIPVLLLLLGWIGLQVKPGKLPPYSQKTPPLETIPLPDDLPAPVLRHFQAVGDGATIPLTHSAVLTGPARLRFKGITFHARARFFQDGGHGYRHYIELAWFGQPVLKANEIILDGTARMELPFGVDEGTEIDQAANLALWGEQAAWMPSVLITDPRFHWEAVDDTTARLFVPLKDGEDEFLVTFDPATGLFVSMEALRYKGKDTEKVRWTVRVEQWGRHHGLLIPVEMTLTWADEGTPWARFMIEDVAYNVDVKESIRAKGW